MVGLALLAEAMSSDGGTVYLARVDAGREGMTTGPKIVVTGHGRAMAPADSAEVQLLLSQMGDGMYSGSGPMTTPTPTMSPIAGDRGLVAPVIAAIAGNGVPEDRIAVVVSPIFVSNCFGPSPTCTAARVGFTLDDPSPARINAIVRAASEGAATIGWVVTSAGVRYVAVSCADLPAQARSAARTEARERAAAQATALEVELGALLTSSEGDAQPVDGGGCPLASVDPAAFDP